MQNMILFFLPLKFFFFFFFANDKNDNLYDNKW